VRRQPFPRAGLEPVRNGQCQKTGSWRASSGIDALNPKTKKPAQWRAFRVSLGQSIVQFDALITLRALDCIGYLITIHNTSSAQGSVVSETMHVKQR